MSKVDDLSLCLVAADIEREPKKYTLKATDTQLTEQAARFDLVALKELSATVILRSQAQDQGILLEGHVMAKLVQRCITSLKDVPETIDHPFSLLLVDPETANRMDEEENYMDPDAPDYDALEGTTVEVGEIVAQTVSILMDPYPRAEGVELTLGNKAGASLNEPMLEKKNPFEVLGKLKDES